MPDLRTSDKMMKKKQNILKSNVSLSQKEMGDFNKDIYEKVDIVEGFIEYTNLQKPEKTIYELLSPQLKQMRMLDIGVGTGRTTRHFAPQVKHYVGIDFSENMINQCRQNYSESDNLLFAVVNARDLNIFEDNYFDFINFSFNGIDYLDHNGRMEAFAEIKRVCAPGGIFSFSTHNLYSIRRFLAIDWQFLRDAPRSFIKRLLFIPVLRLLNEPLAKICKMDYVIDLRTYYVKPEKQIEQLKKLEFENIRIFSVETGKEIISDVDFSDTRDYYFYFLCNKS